MNRLKSFEDEFREVEKRNWPKKGDRLLRTVVHGRRGAQFSRQRGTREPLICSGFMWAGETLIERCERDPIDSFHLIYPILFNYRQGLELAMKGIVGQYSKAAGIHLSNADLNHDLKKGRVLELPSDAIDLRNVRKVMQSVDSYFTSVDGQLAENAEIDWDNC